MGRELSPSQEQLLAERADKVAVMMDGDPPGRRAQTEILHRLGRHVWVRALELPEGSQPDTVPEADLRKLLTVLS
jgi:DNA primase